MYKEFDLLKNFYNALSCKKSVNDDLTKRLKTMVHNTLYIYIYNIETFANPAT